MEISRSLETIKLHINNPIQIHVCALFIDIMSWLKNWPLYNYLHIGSNIHWLVYLNHCSVFFIFVIRCIQPVTGDRPYFIVYNGPTGTLIIWNFSCNQSVTFSNIYTGISLSIYLIHITSKTYIYVSCQPTNSGSVIQYQNLSRIFPVLSDLWVIFLNTIFMIFFKFFT